MSQEIYLCLFVCLQTHCLHLEMAWSLETDGFLKALTSMVARRDWPRDNGTNFVRDDRELQELVPESGPRQDSKNDLKRRNSLALEWGVFERMIRIREKSYSGNS